MWVLDVRNVCEALPRALSELRDHGGEEQTRAGAVLSIHSPVTTVYQLPKERVLSCPVRDANPFFHIAECAWMLGGCRDGRWLDQFVHDFSARYGEGDGSIHGAYGYRWREHFQEGDGVFDLDQILAVGKMLYDDPTTRRAVLTMWDPAVDLGADKRDLPCNTHVYFRPWQTSPHAGWMLDVTVCCRSNDAVWGAYGANAVHMSVMAEVVAGLAGMHLGMYYQISNNLHVYTDILDKMGDLEVYDRYADCEAVPHNIIADDAHRSRSAARADALLVIQDCEEMTGSRRRERMATTWGYNVLWPMLEAHRLWKSGDITGAHRMMAAVAASDWRMAGIDWMLRREERRATRERQA